MTLSHSALKPPILCNATTIALLDLAVAQQTVSCAYLFVGRAGIGKHTTARWLASRLLEDDAMSHPDLLEVEPTVLHEGKLYTRQESAEKKIPTKALQIRLEQIRQLCSDLKQAPLYGSKRVAIIDRAETMNESAANALLKTLEEPGRTVMILVVNQLDLMPPTIVSRCQVVRFYPISPRGMKQVLDQVCPSCVEVPHLIEFAQGSPGRAVEAYEKLQDLSESGLPPHSSASRVDQCMTLAKQLHLIDRELQLWLLDWWQVTVWNQRRHPAILEALEDARNQLNQHCHSQLVWEVCFLRLRAVVEEWQIPVVQHRDRAEIEPAAVPAAVSDAVTHTVRSPNRAAKSVLPNAAELRQPSLFD